MDDAHTKIAYSKFVARLTAMKDGYQTGYFHGRRYGVTIQRFADGRTVKLFAKALGGADIVSGNLFRLANGQYILKPCEMSSAKVIRFLLELKVAEINHEEKDIKAVAEHAAPTG